MKLITMHVDRPEGMRKLVEDLGIAIRNFDDPRVQEQDIANSRIDTEVDTILDAEEER